MPGGTGGPIRCKRCCRWPGSPWTEFPRGKHFPAIEAPTELAADLQAFSGRYGDEVGKLFPSGSDGWCFEFGQQVIAVRAWSVFVEASYADGIYAEYVSLNRSNSPEKQS